MIKRIKKILKREYFIREIVTLFVIVTSMLGFVMYESLAAFSGTIEKTSVASIQTGTIDFTIASTDTSYNSSTKQITLAAGETIEMDMTVTNTTPIPVKYKFYYKPISPTTLPSGVSISILEDDEEATIFSYTGAVQEYTVPETGTYKLETWGAQGGSYDDTYRGGLGGYSYGTVSLTEGTKLYVYVGGEGTSTGTSTTGTMAGGFNGGGKGYSSSTTYLSSAGGGASDIRIGSDSLYSRVIVAGGGGGAGSYNSSNHYSGGAGGGEKGETGGRYSTSYYAGTGGSATTYGNSYYGTKLNSSTYGTIAAFGTGGGAKSTSYNGIAGGGGGWYGGGYGRRSSGGGGSGYVYTSSTASNYPSGCLLNSTYYLTDAATLTGKNTGNGRVKIAYQKEISTSNFDNGILDTSKTVTKTISITNSSTSSITLEIGVEGGYQNNSLSLSSGKRALELKIGGSTYTDSSGANAPELAEGLIPVVYDSTNDVWQITETSSEWYDYDNQIWANAVTVSDTGLREASPGTILSLDDINSMWVWVPRYKYKITSNIGSSSAVTSPPEIDVVFESGIGTTGTALASCSITATNCYYTHPAFRNGSSVYTSIAYDQGGWDEELKGFWVGKFETGENGECASNKTTTSCNTSNLTPIINPNGISALDLQNVSNQFKTALNFANGTLNDSTGKVTFVANTDNVYGINATSNTTNSHMMKNTEWGAVAYLSQSQYGKYGNSNYTGKYKQIYINNSYRSTTHDVFIGRSGGGPNIGTSNSFGAYAYNDNSCGTLYCTGDATEYAGQGASTTGNIYGIYDMNGGSEEVTMGNWNETISSAGFTVFPESKYYDKYTGTSSEDATSDKSIKGDATYETMQWYSDDASFIYDSRPWFYRGGYYEGGTSSGVFAFDTSAYGGSGRGYSFRTVLIP